MVASAAVVGRDHCIFCAVTAFVARKQHAIYIRTSSLTLLILPSDESCLVISADQGGELSRSRRLNLIEGKEPTRSLELVVLVNCLTVVWRQHESSCQVQLQGVLKVLCGLLNHRCEAERTRDTVSVA